MMANLDAYCEAPMKGLEGPAHFPMLAGTAAAAASTTTRPPPKLRQLQVVIRHGDRSPINSLTTPPPRFSCKLTDPAIVKLARLMKAEEGDGGEAPFRVVGLGGTATRAYLTTALLPEGEGQGAEKAQQQVCFPGQLTERGFRQQVANGRFLRARYGEALGPITDPGTELYVRCTNYPRTFQSGAALLLSFLGQADADPTASIRNITVFVQEENAKEPLFGLGLVGASRARSVDPFDAPGNERGPCELAFQHGARQEAAFEPDAGIDEQFYSELGLGPVAGTKAGAGAGAMDLSVADQADPLMGMHCHAKPLPVQLATAVRLKGEADRLFCERFTGGDGGREGTRLGMQPFLTEVVGRFQQAAAGEGGAKLALYSAHDTVLAPLVAALDGYDVDDGCEGRWPPYASRVVMELWEVEGEGQGTAEERHAVRLLYNGRVISSRAKHCPGYQRPAGGEELDETLLPLACFEQYVDRLDDEAGESCLDAAAA